MERQGYWLGSWREGGVTSLRKGLSWDVTKRGKRWWEVWGDAEEREVRPHQGCSSSWIQHHLDPAAPSQECWFSSWLVLALPKQASTQGLRRWFLLSTKFSLSTSPSLMSWKSTTISSSSYFVTGLQSLRMWLCGRNCHMHMRRRLKLSGDSSMMHILWRSKFFKSLTSKPLTHIKPVNELFSHDLNFA